MMLKRVERHFLWEGGRHSPLSVFVRRISILDACRTIKVQGNQIENPVGIVDFEVGSKPLINSSSHSSRSGQSMAQVPKSAMC